MIKERLHAKRASTEEHIHALEETGNAGKRYTCCMKDLWFLALGVISDAGWITQLIFLCKALIQDALSIQKALAAMDLLMILAGVTYTVYLGTIHEKEIPIRHQKNLSFGLTALAGIIGIPAGIACGSAGLFIVGTLNAIGCVPIY